MTPHDWERLKPVFGAALSLPPDERDAFIAKVRGEDAELGRNLADLIREHTTGPLNEPLINFHKLLSPQKGEPGQASADDTATLSCVHIGQVMAGRFRIVRDIGSGGMGDVFEAEDLELKDRVALKVIRSEIASNPEIAGRFKREILLGKRIAHPNVCRIHDLGTAKSEDGMEMLFFTMQFLAGETLASRIKRGRISPAEALPLIENMADGLTAAHNTGIVHRDFKSGNVMLVDSAQGTRAVITDFGLARALDEAGEREALTMPGALAGTVGYMAPEQLKCERVTASADIYSLGVVIYEMVTGRRPFVGNSNLEIALQHLNAVPRPPRQYAPELDTKWQEVILRCLAKSPGERFSSATAVKDTLLGGSTPSRLFMHMARRKLALVSLLFIVAVGFAFAVRIYRDRNAALLGREQRVAVLEFDNVGGDPANQAFCEGLLETLSSQLSELEPFQNSLSVVPASDIRRDRVTSAREARKDFGVTLVISGSVQRSPSGMRLTMNVVDARQLKQLRSHTIFIPQTDVLSMQQGAITQVAELLDVQLRPEAQRRLAQGSTPVPGAYDFYLQGAGYLLNGGAHTDQAITEFNHALERDADYALAHAGLGQAYWSKYLATKDKVWIDQAWRECARSIELGPVLPDPHITLALLNSGTGRYAEAIREARLAIQIDPGNDRAHTELARALDAAGQSAEAEAILQKAIALRPGNWNNYTRLGIFYGKHGKYKEAEAPFKRAIELAPDNPAGYTNLASVYHLEGRETEAEQMLKESLNARPTTKAYTDLATVYFFEQRYADAVPIMEKVTANDNKDYMQWGNLGDAYRWTPGDAEKAGRAYRHAIELAQEAISINPRDGAALSSMALYYAKLGQTARAVQISKKALAAAPNDKGILFNAAIVSELAGDQAKALDYVRGAVAGGYSVNEIATEPELTKLRQDPGYPAIVSRKK